jgi:TatD DNase family protein
VNQPSTNLRLYDAHCHLQDPRLAAPEFIEELAPIGVQRVVVNGTQETDWARVLELAQKHTLVLPSLGLHPWYVADRSPDWLSKLSDSVRSENCAVGEIGLDRWMDNYDLPAQEQVFVQQLALAASLNRPASIHCLKAWGRLLEILESELRPATGFLLHSYGGPAEMIPKFADLGGYFSFSGHFAHARKEKQREAFRRVPIERLLIETDAPDMPLPEELQQFTTGTRTNHPANIRAIYNYASDFLTIPADKFAHQVEQNFLRLFAPLLGLAPNHRTTHGHSGRATGNSLA